MKVYTQNIFKYQSIKGVISKTPINITNITVSKRSKLAKFLDKLSKILKNETCTIAIYDYNKYGYVSIVLDMDEKFCNLKDDIEKIGYRSNY